MNNQEKQVLLLLTLFVIACMFPVYEKCWDIFIIPKWYAATIVALTTLAICTFRAFDQIKLRWGLLLSVAAKIGIFTQFIFIIIYDNIDFDRVFHEGIHGSFENSSSLSSTLCLLLSFSFISVHQYVTNHIYKRICRLVCGTLSALAMSLVLISQSRIGVLYLIVYLLMCLWKYLKLPSKTKAIVGAFCISVSFCMLLTCKIDSTKGRAFIYCRSVEIIRDNPLVGYGRGNFQTVYMNKQMEFFRRNPQSENVFFADNIKHPLNEFVRLWVEFGIIGPLSLMICIVLPVVVYRRQQFVVNLEVCLCIFCFFSYPLSHPLPFYALLMTLFMSVLNVINVKKQVVRLFLLPIILIVGIWLSGLFYIDNKMSSAFFYAKNKKHNRALETYECMEAFFRNGLFLYLYFDRYNCYLYNYSRELYVTSRFDQAYVILKRTLVKDYDMSLLMGDVLFHNNNYQSAIFFYERAQYMCPVRFAPLEGILNCFISMHDEGRAKKVALQIKEKNVKIESTNVRRIKNIANSYLDE